MQGLGNDFFVFDAPATAADTRLAASKLAQIADRHTGVGFDQALMLETARDTHNRVFYRNFNADGTEAEQCGNGARCVAAHLYARAPQLGRDFTMESAAGVVHALMREDGSVSVDMGVPNFDPRVIALQAAAEADAYSLMLDGAEIEIGAVSMGNPHAVLRVSDVKTAPVEVFGRSIGNHSRFANRANVGFMQILGRNHIRLRVFERGVGETLACGTGACAEVAVGRRQGLLDALVRVELPGGVASVSWPGPGERSWLTGPATKVFTGTIEI